MLEALTETEWFRLHERRIEAHARRVQAHLARRPQDHATDHRPPRHPPGRGRKVVLAALAGGPRTVRQIAEGADLPVRTVSDAVQRLRVEGRVRRVPFATVRGAPVWELVR